MKSFVLNLRCVTVTTAEPGFALLNAAPSPLIQKPLILVKFFSWHWWKI